MIKPNLLQRTPKAFECTGIQMSFVSAKRKHPCKGGESIAAISS